MNISLLRLSALIPLAACFLGCGANSLEVTPQAVTRTAKPDNNRIPEPWVSKPKAAWPQIVLTNQAEFDGHSPLQGASSFLIEVDSGQVLAATARHLIGSAGGVEPQISVNQLTRKIRRWKMFPRTAPDDAVAISALAVDGLDNEALDWLVLSIEKTESLPALPLKLRKKPIQVGEPVYLIGCPYSEADCKQNVYSGRVTERAFGDRFRYEIDPPVDIRGFSGAPIVDTKGCVVGVMTVWFDAKMSGDNYLEAGGEDIASIYELVQGVK